MYMRIYIGMNLRGTNGGPKEGGLNIGKRKTRYALVKHARCSNEDPANSCSPLSIYNMI